MKEETKRAVKRSAAVLAAVGCMSLAVSHISIERLTLWGRTAALLSVGMLSPEGGAEALSARMDRIPAKAAAATKPSAVSPPSSSAVTTAPGSTTAASSASVSSQTASVPARGPKGGVVKELSMASGSNAVQGVTIKNSSGKTFDIAKELAILPQIPFKKTTDPQVLIVHTHTTEAYMTYYAGYYNDGDGGRSPDPKKNVCAVGESIAAELRRAGIGVVHDTTVHDSPKYTGAYSRSEATVKANLAKYPGIQVVLDIHRDGVMIDSTTRAKPTAVINGKKAAQMMIIVGTVSTDALPHPHWQDNFHFALQLQKAMAASYAGLMRPVSVVASRYNQHLSRGYLLVEMGSEANTLDEAVYSGQLLGKTLAEVLPKFHA